MTERAPLSSLSADELAAFLAEKRGRGYPHVAKVQFTVPFRRPVIHDGDIAHQFNPRGVHGYQNHALLPVGFGFGVGFSHHDENPTVGMVGIRNKPLAPVNHVVVSVTNNLSLDLGGVGRGNVGLGHCEG